MTQRMTITEETAQKLITKLDSVLEIISPSNRKRKSKRQIAIDAKIAKLDKEFLKR